MKSSSISTLFNSSSMHTSTLSIALNLESAMEFYRSNRFFSILNESIKLVAKNGKFFALSISFRVLELDVSFFAYSMPSLVHGMIVATRQPLILDPHSFNSSGRRGYDPVKIAHLLHHLRENATFLFAVEVAFSIISFFSTISAILISTVSYNAKNSSPKELFSLIKRSWTRPLITSLYVSGLSTAYFVVLFMLVDPPWVYPNLRPSGWAW